MDALLQQRLAQLARARLLRQLKPPSLAQGVRLHSHSGPLLNFSSNDYLGLAGHPVVCSAAARAAEQFGAGSGASRLVCGSLVVHQQLEEDLAAFEGAERALTFSSGYATALGVIPALVGPGDFIVLDRLAHACLVDAARLSGAKLRVFRHNDVADLDRLLGWAQDQRVLARSPDRGNTLIITEAVFSMDGDRAPLQEIVQLKNRYGAWLLVDEAHATGVLGPGRRGLIEALGLAGRVEVPLGTLGKALGAAGGFVSGSGTLCEYLVNRARSFIFSTAPPPAAAAAARASVAIVAAEEGARLAARLWLRVAELHEGLVRAGWTAPPPASPILPLMVGDEGCTMRLAAALLDEGLLVPGIRHPSVPRGRARLRVTVSAAHEQEDVARFLTALDRATARSGVRPV